MPGTFGVACGKVARTQSPKPMRPDTRSMRAPAITSSREAMSIMRFTDAAS